MPVRPKTRFDVFKRDSFTCRYCGRTSPDVVLELDHIVPVCEGGSDDPINLATSCWDCNRGKTGEPLSVVMDGEDPYERAIMLLERERQLREYNAVLAQINERIEADVDSLVDWWHESSHRWLRGADLTSLEHALEKHPVEVVHKAMQAAIRAGKTTGLGYVHACLNNWSRQTDSVKAS